MILWCVPQNLGSKEFTIWLTKALPNNTKSAEQKKPGRAGSERERERERHRASDGKKPHEQRHGDRKIPRASGMLARSLFMSDAPLSVNDPVYWDQLGSAVMGAEEKREIEVRLYRALKTS